jgi:hypothetical protein
VRYFEAGPPSRDVVGWVLRSAVLARRRAEGGTDRLTRAEMTGDLAIDRLVASFAYARCMLLTAAGIVVAAAIVVPARFLPEGPGRAALFGIGFALGALPAAAQIVILVWFSSRGGRFETRVLRTSRRSIRMASMTSGLISALAGVVFAIATYRSRT